MQTTAGRRDRDKAEGDRDKVARDAATTNVSEASNANAQDLAESGEFPDTSAPPPHDETDRDIHDLPRNEAFRHGAVGGYTPDPRAGETGTQDVAPTEEDIRLEATLASHRAESPDVHQWMAAQRRVEPGLEEADTRSGDEAPVVRGPDGSTGRGRVVTERETVSDDDADADATRDRTTGRDADDADRR